MIIKIFFPLALLLSLSNVVGQLIETEPCILDTNPQVIAASKLPATEDSCSFASGISCPSGCCRFHTAVLVCDSDGDEITGQACVCNENTDLSLRDGTTPGGSGPGIPLPPTTPAPAAPPTTRAPINTDPEGRGNDSVLTCDEPTVWQGLGLDRKNCTVTADCANVTLTGNPNAPLCCRSLFCFCDTYDANDMAEECVA